MADRKIIVYSTPTCSYCRRAKDYLARKGVPYVDLNVTENKEAAREMIQKSGQMGVPVISVDGQIVIGFNQAQLDKLFGPGPGGVSE